MFTPDDSGCLLWESDTIDVPKRALAANARSSPSGNQSQLARRSSTGSIMFPNETSIYFGDFPFSLHL